MTLGLLVGAGRLNHNQEAVMRRYWTQEVTITRLANATQYTANDALSDNATAGTILTFNAVAPQKGEGGIIRSLVVHKTDQDTTAAAFRLHLFHTTVVGTGFEDNVEIAITDAEWQTCVGSIAIPQASWLNVITGNLQTVLDVNLGYQCAAADNKLYGVVVVEDTHTPGSGEVFTFKLSGEVG